jgi:hypothetical protein
MMRGVPAASTPAAALDASRYSCVLFCGGSDGGGDVNASVCVLVLSLGLLHVCMSVFCLALCLFQFQKAAHHSKCVFASHAQCCDIEAQTDDLGAGAGL